MKPRSRASRPIMLVLLLSVLAASPTAAYADKLKPHRPGLWIGAWQIEPDVVTDLEVRHDDYGLPVIDLMLSPKGAARLAEVTARSVDLPLPISVDGAVITKPIVRTPILGSTIRISGFEDQEQARSIAASLTEASARWRQSRVAPAPRSPIPPPGGRKTVHARDVVGIHALGTRASPETAARLRDEAQ